MGDISTLLTGLKERKWTLAIVDEVQQVVSSRGLNEVKETRTCVL